MREFRQILQAVQVVQIARLGRAVGEGTHAAFPEFVLIPFDLLADGVDSLIPADTLPLSSAALGTLHALHGVLNALALDQLHRDARPASAHALNIAIRIWDLGSTRENHVVVAHHGLQRASHASVAVGHTHRLFHPGMHLRFANGAACGEHASCRSCS